MNLFEIEKDDIHSKFSDFFLFHSILGFGSFGVVVAATSKSTKEECAVKIIPKKSLNPEELNRLRDEAYILASLKHPNIVKFKDIKETDTKILIAMENVHGGHLNSLMNEYQQKGQWFSETDIALIMKTLMSAIEYIHTKNIVHRDIKPENILIENKNDLTSLKIADFGLSAQYGRSNMSKIMTQQCGTIIFMAPEQLSNKIYSKPVDMWSCGILMYILLAKGNHPLYRPEDNIKKFIKKLNNGTINFPPNLNISILAKNLFQKLTNNDPAERYTADKALNHPWITGNLNDQVPLTSNEMFQSFETGQNFMKIIKSLYFIGSLLRTDNALKIDSQYKELVNKNPKIQSKEFSLEKNYIDSIFNLSDVATKTKASSDVATKPKTSSPPHNKKTFEAVKISSFIPQKMQIIEFPHKNNHKPEENNKNRIFCDEVAFHQLKSDNDLSKLIGMTPNDSKDTNATLNSTNHPPLQNDFLLRIKKQASREKIEKNIQIKKTKVKRATSASLKIKMKKKIKPKNPEIKSKPEIELATEIIKKTEVKPPDSLNTMNKPKRHYSITPISYQLEKVKSKVFNTKNTLPKEEKVKSETLILYASPFPIIRTSIQRNEQFNFQKNLIKPNNKCLISNEYAIKKPITLTLNPPPISVKYNNKRIRLRKKIVYAD